MKSMLEAILDNSTPARVGRYHKSKLNTTADGVSFDDLPDECVLRVIVVNEKTMKYYSRIVGFYSKKAIKNRETGEIRYPVPVARNTNKAALIGLNSFYRRGEFARANVEKLLTAGYTETDRM